MSYVLWGLTVLWGIGSGLIGFFSKVCSYWKDAPAFFNGGLGQWSIPINLGEIMAIVLNMRSHTCYKTFILYWSPVPMDPLLSF